MDAGRRHKAKQHSRFLRNSLLSLALSSGGGEGNCGLPPSPPPEERAGERRPTRERKVRGRRVRARGLQE